MALEVLDRPKVIEGDTQIVPKHSPKYKVLLHNDDSVEAGYVVHCLLEVVNLGEPQSIAVMMEAHQTGLGLIGVWDIEPAEHYTEGLKSKGLTISMESEDS